GSQIVISPNLTKYWMPIVQQDIKPKVGMLFSNIDIAKKFYRNYGANGGFDVRTYTTKRFRSGVINKQYMVCNRQRFKLEIPQNTSKSMSQLPSESGVVPRQRVSKR
ncbi:Far-red impaired responsive (FAR1) family protein, partial [Striga hermonthica]